MSSDNTESANENKSVIRDFESLLQNNFGRSLNVISYSIDNLVSSGDNFGSNILKVSAKIRHTIDSPIEEHQFVAKTVLKNSLDQSIEWTHIFDKEIFMYTDIIQFYKTVELENGIDEKKTIVELFPKLCGYRLSLNPASNVVDNEAIILLENLKTQGYYVMDKKVGLNFHYSTTVIKALARFHALGIVARTNYHERFEFIKSKYGCRGIEYPILNKLYDQLSILLEENPRLAKHIQSIKATRIKNRSESNLTTQSIWSTIVHNDLWINNMLFRNNEVGNVESLKIIDFQTYSVGSLFSDLTFFLLTTLNDEMKNNHIDEIIDIYYETLILYLTKFHVDVNKFSREAFDEQFKKDAINEFMHCTLAMKFFAYDGTFDDDKDAESIFDIVIHYKSNISVFYKLVDQILQIFERKNWLH